MVEYRFRTSTWTRYPETSDRRVVESVELQHVGHIGGRTSEGPYVPLRMSFLTTCLPVSPVAPTTRTDGVVSSGVGTAYKNCKG